MVDKTRIYGARRIDTGKIVFIMADDTYCEYKEDRDEFDAECIDIIV